MPRIIGHLDMDAFFAAVEERDHPRHKGKPIVVGADPLAGRGRGVVSTANYKAREYGIKSALPISTAWRFSEEAKKAGKPPAVFFGGNFPKYGAVSAEIMKIIRRFAPNVEQASVDEAYLDLSFCEGYPAAEVVAEKIKSAIKKEAKLTASIGIGPNKLVAKIASDYKKPDGLTVLPPESVEPFLNPLSIRKIPGIGPKTEKIFSDLKISKIQDLKKYSVAELERLLGKWGVDIYQKSRGQDDAPVVEDYDRKSIGEQETFSKDSKNSTYISDRVKIICGSIVQRFMESEFNSFKTIGITVRFHDFITKTRARTLPAEISRTGNLFSRPTPGSIAKELEFEALKLITPFLDRRENPENKKIRLIGFRIEKLS